MVAPPEKERLEIDSLLTAAVRNKASDIHLKPGHVPVFRVNGKLSDLARHPVLMAQDINRVAERMMDKRQLEQFQQRNEIDLAYSIAGVGRFRVNIFRQSGTIAIAIRTVPFHIKNFQELFLPPVLAKICEERRGMVLVTGATGSGKSTTLAAMVNYINQSRTDHIITIEDPIEFMIRDNKSIVSQREVGFDTNDFINALRAALRQDPDVILVGEMRDYETINTALLAAETGHLVFSTLHTTNVMETINRVLTVFQATQQTQVRHQLATALRAIVSQRLMPRSDGLGRVPAVEIMINNARITDCIKDINKTHEIVDAIEQSYTTYGMQSFDMSLLQLVRSKLISIQEALRNASNPGDLRLRLEGVSGAQEARYDEYNEGQQKKQAKPEDAKKVVKKKGDFDDLLERF